MARVEVDHSLDKRRKAPPDQEPMIFDGDGVALYLQEIGEFSLLSFEEEKRLAEKIEKGREAQETLEKIPDLTLKAEECLTKVVETGRRAREDLTKANTRLVVSIAKRYLERGVPFLDLIQEGNIGLMRAVEKFDPQRGCRFSTYATEWIRQRITRAIPAQGRTIRVPAYINNLFGALAETMKPMGLFISDKITHKQVSQIADQMGLEPQKVEFLLKKASKSLSLETKMNLDKEGNLGDIVEDENSLSPSRLAEDKSLRDDLDTILATLTPRENKILELRFGLKDDQSRTLEKVGQKFGLTRERIRQIEKKALHRLRHSRHSRRLRDYRH